MAALTATNPTLIDLAKLTDPDGKIATVVELLGQTNEILTDMTFIEGNLETGHRTTVRTGLPTATWRKLYQGVQPSKSTVAQVTENCGMLEAYAVVDKDLAELNQKKAAFMLQENQAFLEAMNQEMAGTVFYGNEKTALEEFTGFAPRFNNRSTAVAASAENVIHGGGSGTDNASIWLVVWGPNTCHGIIPKGSTAGFQMNDLGQETQTESDGSKWQAYVTHYQWKAGLSVRDWRYVVRIANIDKSALTSDLSGASANLHTLMFRAIERVPNISLGRAAFYMSRDVRTMVREQAANGVKNSTLTVDNVGGVPIMSFHGIPLRRVDALAADEALVPSG
jgi:hypothetical protein